MTYGLLRLTPDISSGVNGIDVNSYMIRSGNDRYTLNDLPIFRSLPKAAREDILYWTFEAEEDERAEFLEIQYEVADYDETTTISFRAIEHRDEMIHFEVEDQGGDWLPVEDVRLSELLPDAFLRILEMCAMDLIHDHNIDRLPMASES